eukprot:TRINITY_DN11303_c0_g1_i4.p3 TRINITY_DN11303_c0_g1~~TRINITY_DN11303_c0_g1_i4.p3  ORF type:complete len:117 (+),score=35.17 TRINITY_DN11303_c0_g1_i4:2-352(+)
MCCKLKLNLSLTFFSVFNMAAMIRIPDELKMAREFALLGNYDTALVYYDGVSQALSQHIDLCSSSDRSKWTQARDQVVSEKEQVKAIMNELAMLKADADKKRKFFVQLPIIAPVVG